MNKIQDLCIRYMGRSYSALVQEFMEAANQMALDPEAATSLAKNLVHEEVMLEFFPALEKFRQSASFENKVELLDAICDSIYVLLWTGLALNLPVHAGFLEVSRSNLAKIVDGKVLKNPETGKVQKPAGWTPPDLAAVLLEQLDAVERVQWKGGVRVHGSENS